MSIKALNWSLAQEGLAPTVKIVLIAMADSAGNTGKAFSSNKTIMQITGHSKEETISDAHRKLIELGIIADTGKRMGDTGKIKVFQLPLEACNSRPSDADLALFSNPPSNGVLKSNPIPRQSPANPPPIPRSTESTILEDGSMADGGTSAAFASGTSKPIKTRSESQNKAWAKKLFCDDLKRLWQVAHMKFKGRVYVINGVDSGAVRNFYSETAPTPTEIIQTAEDAWKHGKGKFNCDNCVSLSYLCRHYHEIAAEIDGKRPAQGTRTTWAEGES